LDANLKNILRDFTGKLFPIDVVVGKPGSEIFERFGFYEADILKFLKKLIAKQFRENERK